MSQRLHPEDGVDVAFTAALTTLSLAAWASTFRGPGLWWVGLGATLVGLLVAVVVQRLGRGPEVVAVVLAVVYAAAAGPVAAGRVGLDALDLLGAGARASLEGWPRVVLTHPPVDATGAALLPVALLCLLAAGLTAAVAMRSAAPGRPLLLQLLLLVGVLFCARAEAVGALLHGLVFGLVALAWLRVRGAQSETVEAGRDPGRGRRALAGAAMVAVAALVAVAVAGSPPVEQRLVLRGLLPAYDVSALRTPLDSFRDYTERSPAPRTNVFDERLLRVDGVPAGARVRFAALDTYDGTRWLAANDTDPGGVGDRFLRLSSTVDNPAEGEPLDVVVSPLPAWALPWVPTVGSVQAFGFTVGGADAQESQDRLRYNLATQTGVLTRRLQPEYAFTTLARDLPLEADTVTSEAVDEDLYEAGAFLDAAIAAWAAGATTPAEAVLQVAERLRRAGRYSDGAVRAEADIEAGQSVRRLGADFVLATPSVGNDEQYAAAMALMANRLRVPARVVVGAVLPDSGVVRGRDVEAWVEVRAADGTWRTLATERFMGRRPPPRSAANDPDTGSPPERIFPEQTPDDESPPREQEQRPDPTPQPEPEEPEGGEDAEAADGSADPGASPWLGRGLLALLVLALPGLVPALKWWRRRRRLRAPAVTRRYAGAWAELVDTARDLGQPVPPGLTRPAQARVLDRGPELGGLAVEADVRIFGAGEPTEEDAAAFWALVRDERSGLAAAYPLRRRLRAVFSLASLRRLR